MKGTGVLLAAGLAFVILFTSGIQVHAQVVTTPYWCGSYWSSQPCNYNWNYNYNYGYSNPYNYYYSYPYYNYYTYPAPTCTLTYAYANTGYYNNYYYGHYRPITLSWSSTNATSGYISPSVGSVSPFGMQVVYPFGYTTYTMTVYGPGGTNTCQTNYYQQYYYYYPYYQYPYTGYSY